MPENYDIPPIISLHRYFCAVARMQKEYERVLQSPEHEEKRKTLKPDMFAIYLHSGPASVLYYWYGALCPVKEGYEKLGLRDARIDALLKSTRTSRLLSVAEMGLSIFKKTTSTSVFLVRCVSRISCNGFAISRRLSACVSKRNWLKRLGWRTHKTEKIVR
jgi:hypothetical protein